MQDKDLDVAWLQTVDEVHLLVPTPQDVHKSDVSFQVHPTRLQLTVKGETLLSGDLPEPVEIDGMTLLNRALPTTFLEHSSEIVLLCAVQAPFGCLKRQNWGAKSS